GKPQIEHDYLYWEFTSWNGEIGKQAIRKGDFKAIRQNVRENPDAGIELYNLKNDPGETMNVAAYYPEIVQEMKVLFKEARTESAEFPLFKR
ncbi:MAG: arylsulfatase, partial [Candidatus Marinimicrobia bacterium]|nr:arylsulfatase [Candidatus Neomarinimicrobiota bacterium]